MVEETEAPRSKVNLPQVTCLGGSMHGKDFEVRPSYVKNLDSAINCCMPLGNNASQRLSSTPEKCRIMVRLSELVC